MASSKATLTIDGKSVSLPILPGTHGAPMIDIRSLYAQTGHFTYDPGFMCSGSCMSSITFIDGEEGKLLYRGYRIEDLAENCSYMEVCYLLIYGELPGPAELRRFEGTVVGEMYVNARLVDFLKGFKSNSHPMAIMVGVVGALSAFMHEDYNFNNPLDREAIAIKLVAKIPTLAALTFRTSMGLPLVMPRKDFSFMKNFLYMMFANPMEEFNIHPDVVRCMDAIFIVHADHEQNASTSTVRIAGSSLANPFACIAAGIGSLWGPYHGGANEAVLNMLEELLANHETIDSILGKAKDKSSGFRLMGFGHRIYKNFDPRAKLMQKMCHRVLSILPKSEVSELLDMALALEQKALSDEYFISRKLYPNVDFYTGIVYKALGFPKSMFTVLFAVQRTVGWTVQWNESISENIQRISRPRQLYVGNEERRFMKMEERKEPETSLVRDVPKICALTNLMKL